MPKSAILFTTFIFHIMCEMTVSTRLHRETKSFCEDQLQLKAVIVTSINKEPLQQNPMIFVDNSIADTDYKCGTKETSLSKNFSVLFDANDYKFWNRRANQVCDNCNETIVSIKNNHPLAPICNLDRSKDSIECNVNKVKLSRQEIGVCNKNLYFDSQNIVLDFYSPSNEKWTMCDSQMDTQFPNAKETSFFKCNISHTEEMDDEFFILRMAEIYKPKHAAGLSFIKKKDCVKEAFFSIKSDSYQQNVYHLVIILSSVLIGLITM